MKIITLSYADLDRNWYLQSSHFDNLSMLVGASGVGKTQILKSIMNLKRIMTKGHSISGAKWHIKFETLNHTVYEWSGEFEKRTEFSILDDIDNDESPKANIIEEKLLANGKEVILRNDSSIWFNGSATPKLSANQSATYLLKAEDSVQSMFTAFEKIIYNDQSNSTRLPYKILRIDKKQLKNLKDLTSIQESNEHINTKIYLSYKQNLDVFVDIKNRFMEVFPQVEDVKVDILDDKEDSLPLSLKDHPFIQIKEKGVNKWIEQSDISSGMFRTLIQISEIYLCNEGTVFLVDEFENSLGINCIDELTNDILSSGRQLQFILTSHHPYIINNIPFQNWKIVTRDKGTVRTHNADAFNLGKSKHQAFMQLIQLDAYQTGMWSDDG